MAQTQARYDYIRPYERPEHYSGPDHYGWYPVAGRSRDSEIWEESNFDAILARLGGESETVKIVRDSHWAVGWVETLYVHESDRDRLALADGLRGNIELYPILDETDYSQRTHDAICQWWNDCTLGDRVEHCRAEGVSIFAARRVDSIPERVYERLNDSSEFA